MAMKVTSKQMELILLIEKKSISSFRKYSSSDGDTYQSHHHRFLNISITFFSTIED